MGLKTSKRLISKSTLVYIRPSILNAQCCFWVSRTNVTKRRRFENKHLGIRSPGLAHHHPTTTLGERLAINKFCFVHNWNSCRSFDVELRSDVIVHLNGRRLFRTRFLQPPFIESQNRAKLEWKTHKNFYYNSHAIDKTTKVLSGSAPDMGGHQHD